MFMSAAKATDPSAWSRKFSRISHHLWGTDDDQEGKHTRRLTDLATRYPRAFALEKYRPHRPLKVGVAADILACCPDLDRRKLGVALAAYTRRVMYLRGLVAGAARVDLDGNVCGEVSAGDAEHAAAILASREARRIAAAEAKGAARVARQTATTAAESPASAPPAAKVLTLKERPVLRLPASRRQIG